MALLTTILAVANQATKVLSLTELTGVYSATNLTGYGASQVPTGTREITDINSASFYILMLDGTFTFEGSAAPTVTNDIYSVSLSGAEAQSLAGGTALFIDLSSTTDYEDGVYKSLYYNWFLGAAQVNAEDVATLSVADTDEFTNAAFISIDIEGDGNFLTYEILSIDTANSTITINATITTNSDVDYKVGYLATSYFQNVHDINHCIHSDIAKNACSNCGCGDTKKKKLWLSLIDFFGIQTNMDRGNYSCAKEIIDSITIYCSKSGCGC